MQNVPFSYSFSNSEPSKLRENPRNMAKFQISGTVFTGKLTKQAVNELAKQLNMSVKRTNDVVFLENKQAHLLIEMPLIQGKFEKIELLEQVLQDSLKQCDCLYNIEIYEVNGRPIDRWQG